jgi:hypothetical protein
VAIRARHDDVLCARPGERAADRRRREPSRSRRPRSPATPRGLAPTRALERQLRKTRDFHRVASSTVAPGVCGSPWHCRCSIAGE